MEKKNLCFFTNSYPYGKGETFIENELNYIAPFFDTIYLFHKIKTGEKREVPSNVKLTYIDPPISISKRIIVQENFYLFISILFQELFFSRQKKMFLQKLKYNTLHFINSIYYSREIKKKLSNDILKEACFYSYWFFDWNLSLSILKKKNTIGYNVTRAHGFDVYEDNGKPNYLPARKFCLTNTDNIFAISHAGENYLKKLYPKYSHKISCSYLGTKDFGNNSIPTNPQLIHLVSCSNVNSVKRLYLIIDILKHFNSAVLWTHIGDGVLLEDIKNKSKKLPKNITIDFKGRMSQNQIFEFYNQTPIDVFVNCSVSEGLPVSIMEAISFGIPVVATNVGGTSEIVNSNTGVLIEKDFVPEQVCDIIIKLKNNDDVEQFRKQVKQFWQNNFFSDTNYLNFVANITNY